MAYYLRRSEVEEISILAYENAVRCEACSTLIQNKELVVNINWGEIFICAKCITAAANELQFCATHKEYLEFKESK